MGRSPRWIVRPDQGGENVAKSPEEICTAFVEEMKACWGHDLSAVVLYGSAARKDFVPGRSGIDFLVLVREVDPRRLLTLRSRVRHWRRDRVSLPLVMRPGMVTSALDSYPLEFLTMQAGYRVLHGEDPLRDLVINREDVRRQCERDLRGKLLHLRAGAIECGGKRHRIAALIRASLPAMTAILQGMLYVAGRPHALVGTELEDAGRDAFDLDTGLFHDLLRLRIEKHPPDRDTLEGLLIRYLRELERLVVWADSGGAVQAAAR
jgi:predicted nucleotidyltransferase